MRARLLRASWPKVALLAVLGLIACGAGIGLRTIWLPSSDYVATATIPANTAAVITGPGVLEMMPGPVQVTAVGSPDKTLLLARGRQDDVQAWVQGAQVATITGLAADHRLSVAVNDGSRDVPDPATSDLWVDSVTGTGTANYTFRQTSGRFLLLLGVVGGAGAPTTVSMTWPQTIATPWSWPLIVAGALLVLVAVAMAIVLGVRYRRHAADEVSLTLRPKVKLTKGPDATAADTKERDAKKPDTKGPADGDYTVQLPRSADATTVLGEPSTDSGSSADGPAQAGDGAETAAVTRTPPQDDTEGDRR